MKKLSIAPCAAAASLLLLAGCQTPPPAPAQHADHFERQTKQSLNPVTGNYEQQTPYGPRGNKADGS